MYCLGVAAERYDVGLMNFVQMSNHLHDAFYDRHGNAPAFYEHFHKLLAKCVNALRGRWENVFSSEQVNVVRLETEAALVKELAYIATNPVVAGLVERATEWPGASGYLALLQGAEIRVSRPTHFFDDAGSMPAEVTLKLAIPPELGDHARIVSAVRERVEETERAEAHRRAAEGSSVLGKYRVLRQSWRESPTSREPRRGLRPTFAARSLWARLEAIQRKREFTTAYRKARQALLAGTPIPFPPGTYWLRRFVHVAVSSIEKTI